MLVDNFSRSFTYLRLSLTELCNFRCSYCLPDGTECTSHAGELSIQEIKRLVTAFALLGTKKIRLTGGEPSLRQDLCQIISTCKSAPGIEQVALTTNGYRLQKDVELWRNAGLDALNLSIDSLNPSAFKLITGSGRLASILSGLERAQQLGFKQVKVNSVLLREQNAGELGEFLNFVKTRKITLRFIELMRTGDNAVFFDQQHLSGNSIQQQLVAQGWVPAMRNQQAGPAKEFVHPNYLGAIGLIMPYSKDFCADCNRLRVSSQGSLFLCLFAQEHHSFRHLLQSNDPKPLMDFLAQAITGKLASHDLHHQLTGSTRNLAMIGG